MKHGMVSVSGYDVLNQSDLFFFELTDGEEKNKIDQEWNKKMAVRGFAIGNNNDCLQELFDLICLEFADTFGEKIPISLLQGYITKDRGKKTVRHNQTARIFSQSTSIYIDVLMRNNFWDYAAACYLWARFSERTEITSECFGHILWAQNCCRKGRLGGEDGVLHLRQMIAENLEDHEIVLIGDLYWCMMAFAMCHEVAHIYHKHGEPKDKAEARAYELQADAAGYDVYLKLMVKHMKSTSDTVSSVFREYLYAAPMILFLFYHDLFAMGYWMYGEVIPNTHPEFMERIDKLLEISQDEKYEFDTAEGNVVLSNYFDISDKYLQELWYKLKNGKLSERIRQGGDEMENGFSAAYALDEEICKRIEEQAKVIGYDIHKLRGLWNVAAQVSTESFGEHMGLVLIGKEKSLTIKGLNIIYNQKALLKEILETGLTITKPSNSIETIRTALYLVFKVAMLSTIEITDIHAKVLAACYKENAYARPIEEKALLTLVPEASSDDLTTLDKMRCIEIVDGYVRLNEGIVFTV